MLTDRWLVFEDGTWREGTIDPADPKARFSDIRYYYGNLIDYARVAMCLVAAATLALDQPVATAVLLLGSTLLDWVDGPVARAHDQCTIFGSGVDWLADILVQVVTLVWLGRLAPALLPVLVLAAAVELANGIFDFAVTATGRYPVLARQGGFGVILDWSMPGGKYAPFGTFLWLAYPIFALAWCLDLSWPVKSDATRVALRAVELLLLAPAVLYVWCELASLWFIVSNWQEAPRRSASRTFADGPAGMACLGALSDRQQQLLRDAWSQGVRALGPRWQASLDRKAVFWVNFWQRSGDGARLGLPCIDELDAWVRELFAKHYDTHVTELDGYGLIVNPAGSATQSWHLDYKLDYSTIFIPLTAISTENALQYVVLPAAVHAAAYQQAAASPDAVDLQAFAGVSEWVSVRQLLVPAFTAVKLDFGAIHRGIANTGGYDRVVFWISAIKRGPKLAPEPLVTSQAEYLAITRDAGSSNPGGAAAEPAR